LDLIMGMRVAQFPNNIPITRKTAPTATICLLLTNRSRCENMCSYEKCGKYPKVLSEGLADFLGWPQIQNQP